MSFGPNPWHQTNWDARAAGNFIGGGAGSGLIVATAYGGPTGMTLTVMLIAALALVGFGLFCVWLEIGRPLRAVNVFINPRTSWMSREAFVGLFLFPVGAVTAFLSPGWLPATVVLALAFLYCQSRMLPAARGIPAWREPTTGVLIAATGLTEGFALWVAATPWHGVRSAALLGVFALLVLVRQIVWIVYRRRLKGRIVKKADEALAGAGRWLLVLGTIVPLFIVVVLLTSPAEWRVGPFEVAAGVLAWGAGAWLKFVLVTRAAFNQGFALKRLPVRGVRV